MGGSYESILDEFINDLNIINSDMEMKASKKIKAINKLVVRATQRQKYVKEIKTNEQRKVNCTVTNSN